MNLIKYVQRLVLVLVLGFVSSCASVPITSMIQLAAMGSSGLEQVDPTEIRVRVSASPGFEIDVARTTMERSLGFMRGFVSVPTYVLRLTPADVQKFLDIRKSALAKDSRAKRTFSVSAPFSKTPKNPKAVTIWTDLRFSSDGSWVVLLDGAELVIKTAP